ncbi:DUF3310 domain-containing protein [Atopobiaceae bacterium HCP3S3_F7]|jgi:hypothetical protein|uniref:DUF3310 domain-containing protein n=1 Tax=Collinsella sp. Sow4_E3 TaxID=3438776 RepID=UPI003F8DA4CA
MNNNVSHPAHYTQGPVHPACGEVVECITITEHHNYNVGNAIKYLWRADHKADALEDLAKAAQYIQFEIDRRKYEAARREPTLFSDDKTETVTNSHVCMDGTRVPGTFCAGRALADMLGLEVSTDYPGRAGN